MNKILTLVLVLVLAAPAVAGESYLEHARDIAHWLETHGRDTEDGRVWPAVPGEPGGETVTHLYSGTAGVVLFLLETHRASGKRRYLKAAKRGADELLATLPEAVAPNGAGLYTGIAGLGFVFEEVYRVTRDPRYRAGTKRVVSLLRDAAQSKGDGIEWNDVTDIIGGGAGIGLFLLYAAQETEDPATLDLARRVGVRLAELAIETDTGSKWAMSPEFPRLMPNFSHGTAGVAYFLASLYQYTGDRAFLDAALAGAAYLVSVADTTNDGCLVFHHEPDGEDLYYLGWCHGPTGTARLFYRLWQTTNDPTWMEWVERSARSVLRSGIPEEQTPGFWNNVSQCCGSAGVAEFFLSLHEVTGKAEYLAFARRVTDDLVMRASSDEHGMRWVQAEHRVRPDHLQAQTGYMQGAAGIGLWLLRLHAFDKGRPQGFTFPDSPFGGIPPAE